MFRPLLAPVLAAALALSPVGAAPARADGEDLAKVLAGLAGLYFVGRAVNQQRIEAGRDPLPWNIPGWGNGNRPGNGRGWGNGNGQGNGWGDGDAPGWDNGYGNGNGWGSGYGTQRPALPSYCIRNVDTRGGLVRGYDAECLEQALPRERLPRSCEVRVEARRGSYDLYRSSCLAQAGYRMPRAG